MKRENVLTVILAILLSGAVFGTMIVRSLGVLGYERTSDEIVSGEENIIAGNVYDRNGVLIAIGGEAGNMEVQGSETAVRSFSNLFGIPYGYLKSPFYIRSAAAEILYGLSVNSLTPELFTKTGNKGNDVQLTLDYTLNEKILSIMNEEIGEGAAAAVCVYNYRTGEIIAAVNSPTFNLNDTSTYPYGENGLMSADADGGSGSNKLVMQYYAPDSTFKPILDAITFDYDPSLFEETIDCTGEIVLDGENIVTDEGHGTVDLKTALALSCNIFQESIVFTVPNEILEAGVKNFDLNRESPAQTTSGLLYYTGKTDFEGTFNKAAGILGEGQTAVTPLQLARMYGALLNGGVMLTPKIIVGEADGESVQAVSEKAAEAVKEGLIEAVQNPEGTCRNLKDEEISICGKTGTSSASANSCWCTAGILDEETPYVIITGIFGVEGATGFDTCQPVVKEIIDAVKGR